GQPSSSAQGSQIPVAPAPPSPPPPPWPPATQLLLLQSPSSMQTSAFSQPGQTEPPQSTSVSSPSRMPFVQSTGTHSPAPSHSPGPVAAVQGVPSESFSNPHE